MSSVYLSLGANLGDRKATIQKALAYIAERVGSVIALSSYYETKPWGYQSSEMYLNVAVEVTTELKPEALLAVTQAIEHAIGRQQKTIGNEYQDRMIDIDILLYDDRIIHTPDLTIPHPLMHQRAFVMQPMSEIAPDIVHPVLQQTMAMLYAKGWSDDAPSL